MIINLTDKRVSQAISYVREQHLNVALGAEFEKLFEQKYHCKIVSTDDPWCTTGHLSISEEKYYNWFILQFGDAK